jgi:hypothetical protein
VIPNGKRVRAGFLHDISFSKSDIGAPPLGGQ